MLYESIVLLKSKSRPLHQEKATFTKLIFKLDFDESTSTLAVRIAEGRRSSKQSILIMPRFEIYQDRASQWRWRLIAGNGEIVAVSEAYVDRYGAERSARRVKEISSIAMIS